MINSPKILLFISLIVLSKTDLSIIGPLDLVDRFRGRPIETHFGRVGLKNDFYIHGELFFDLRTESHDACDPLEPLNLQRDNGDSSYREDFKILMAYNGGCSVAQKARNAQNAGFSMLLLVNIGNTPLERVMLNDDGESNDIFIPVSIINSREGKEIHGYIETHPQSRIMIEVNFSKEEKEEPIDFKFFFSSSEPKAYELIGNMVHYLKDFGDQVIFKPFYVVHQNPYYEIERPQRAPNCLSKGRYCYFPKESTITQDGQKILMEDLRQKCLYDFSVKMNNMKNYYDYMNLYYKKCMSPEEPKFNERCAKESLEKLGYPVDFLDDCIANSFGVQSIYSTNFIDQENIILKNEYDEIIKNELTTFPSIIINNKPLMGLVKEEKIASELCNNVFKKPEFCSFITGKTDEHVKINENRKFWVYFLIIALLIVNVLIFVICRKYILERVKDRIDLGSIDLDGRINNVINNYFAMKKNTDNDYQAFDTSTNLTKDKNKSPIEGTVNTI